MALERRVRTTVASAERSVAMEAAAVLTRAAALHPLIHLVLAGHYVGRHAHQQTSEKVVQAGEGLLAAAVAAEVEAAVGVAVEAVEVEAAAPEAAAPRPVTRPPSRRDTCPA